MMQDHQNDKSQWHTNLMSTCSADTRYCCFAFWCQTCASYSLRKRALNNDMSRYLCCAGHWPCSGRCGESRCPKFCLFMEAFCCLASSVASTRLLLRDEFNIQPTRCDIHLMMFMLSLHQFACIFSTIATVIGISHLGCTILDRVFCMACVLMQTQHKIEMDFRDGKLRGPMDAPPVQQMSRLDQQVPPSNGHP